MSADTEPPLITRPRAALLTAITAFGFVAVLLLAAFASQLRSGDDGRAHVLSRSAVGFSGLAEALRLSGRTVVVNRGLLPEGRSEGLFIVTPGPSADEAAIRPLGFKGPTLVILDKWLVFGDPKRPGWVQKAGLRGAQGGFLGQAERGKGVAAPVLVAQAGTFPTGRALTSGPVESLQSFAPKGWTPVLRTTDGAVVLARAPDRPIYVLADPDLMNNHALKDERSFETALTIVRSLSAGDGPVIFDLRLNGLGRERSPLRLLFDPPLTAVSLSLAAAAALAGWQAFARFGPAQRRGRAIPLGKAALVDNSAALVRLAGREHRMAAGYAEMTCQIAARTVGAPHELTGQAQRRFLDRLGRRRGLSDSLDDLTMRAATAQTPARALEIAEKLYAWRTSLLLETRKTAEPVG